MEWNGMEWKDMIDYKRGRKDWERKEMNSIDINLTNGIIRMKFNQRRIEKLSLT
jgi:hypothetical protein